MALRVGALSIRIQSFVSPMFFQSRPLLHPEAGTHMLFPLLKSSALVSSIRMKRSLHSDAARVRRYCLPLLLLFSIVISTAAQTPELLLFGGNNNRVLLGCLNCSPLDRGSVCNRTGPHGSMISDVSIWNRKGTYGSEISEYSPWNRIAVTNSLGVSTNPPLIVDRAGNSYGYFTSNPVYPQRTRIPTFVAFLNNVRDLSQGAFCND